MKTSPKTHSKFPRAARAADHAVYLTRGLFERPARRGFNVNKCHILHVGTRNQKFDYEMNGVKLDSVQCVKDLAKF